MATISDFIDGTTGEKNVASRHVDTYVVKNESGVIDFSKVTIADADVIQLVNVPKGAVPLRTLVCVSNAANPGTSLTADIGDNADTDRYHAAVDLTASTDTTGDVGTIYSGDDTIDATMNLVGAAPTSGTFEFTVWYGIHEAKANS